MQNGAARVLLVGAAIAFTVGCSDGDSPTIDSDAGRDGGVATDASLQCPTQSFSPLEMEATVPRLPAPLLCDETWCRHSPWPGDVAAIAFAPGGGILINDTLGVALWTQASDWQRVLSAPVGPLQFVNGGGNRLFALSPTALFEIGPDGAFIPVDLGGTGPAIALWASPGGTLWKATSGGQIHRRVAMKWELVIAEPGMVAKSLSGSADDNVYAIVQRNGRGTTLDWWNGIQWRTVVVPNDPAAMPAGALSPEAQVFVTPGGHVFVADEKSSQVKRFDPATLVFVSQDTRSGRIVSSGDGSLWTLSSSQGKPIHRFDQASGTWNLIGTLPAAVYPDRIAANNQGELVNAGSTNGITTVTHLTGGKWTARHKRLTPSEDFSVSGFAQDGPKRIVGVAGNFVFAIDSDGLILESTLLSSGACRNVTMESVWSDGATAVAVGHTWTDKLDGALPAIYERTAGVWQAVPMPAEKGGLNAVAGPRADLLIAVGDRGRLFQRNQGSWTMAPPFTAKNLLDVQVRIGFQPVVAAWDAVFIAGDAGWIEHPGPTDLQLRRLWMSEAGDIVALAYAENTKSVYAVTIDPSQPATMWKRELIATKVTDIGNARMSFVGPSRTSLTAVVHRNDPDPSITFRSYVLRIGKNGQWKPDEALAAPIFGAGFLLTEDGRALLGHGENIVSTRLPLP